MGNLLGNGIRLGFDAGLPLEVMAAGEGLETMLSLRTVMPAMPMVAATSANHLAGAQPADRLRTPLHRGRRGRRRPARYRAPEPPRRRCGHCRAGASSATRGFQRGPAAARTGPSRGMAARPARPGGCPCPSAAGMTGRHRARRAVARSAGKGGSRLVAPAKAAPAACQSGDPATRAAWPSTAVGRPALRWAAALRLR